MISELRVLFFYFRQRLHVNSASQVTLRDLEPAGIGTVSRTCNSYFALYKTERQRELLQAAAFSKTCLKHRSGQNEENFMKLTYTYTLNLLDIMLAYYCVTFIFNNPYPIF